MLIRFFAHLRSASVPVSVREHLTLLEALKAGLGGGSLTDFYHLARLTLVKDEALYDKFDRAFATFTAGLPAPLDALKMVPADWLQDALERHFTPEEKARLEALGWDELMQELARRLAEQTERHDGGSKWIGTGGTSPFGHGGFNPRGIRIGGPGGQKSAVKVWEQRQYRDYDGERELGTRNLKVALRRLRRFAREGAAEELALDDTITATAANAGMLDIRLRPERRNRVKVLLLMDVGGTMDEHVHRAEELFSAARSEFRHLEFFYFHNCVYDHLWRHNARRHSQRTPTLDLLHTYNRDWRLILVGDATMSPYEILHPGGSVEYHNPEPGAVWLQRLTQAFPRHAWINPEPAAVWDYRQSITLIRDLVHGRMYPLTLSGMADAMRTLSK
ncbi:MAG: VWA domain-containing protein [Proteobacteria bacterium]|nr:VWA domain-containing protein [Pseudomonadota bacterium]